jgi:ABC-type multidrug transport system permease subunit
MFYPLDSVPAWLKYAAYINPLTWHTDVLRYCTIGIGDLWIILAEFAAFILFSIAAFVLSVKALKGAI